jgi:CDGSH-type Zn-finger protein
VIVPYRDGPYLVRGPVTLRDQNGETISAQRRTVALCRCGKSRIRPFCDGTHQVVRFQAPSAPENRAADQPSRPGLAPAPALTPEASTGSRKGHPARVRPDVAVPRVTARGELNRAQRALAGIAARYEQGEDLGDALGDLRAQLRMVAELLPREAPS